MPNQEIKCLTVSVETAAKKLGISRGLAYSMIHQKHIPALFFGRCIRVPRHALEELLNGQFDGVKAEETNSKSGYAPG